MKSLNKLDIIMKNVFHALSRAQLQLESKAGGVLEKGNRLLSSQKKSTCTQQSSLKGS